MDKFGFGMMRLPLLDENDPTKVDIEEVKKMVDTFIENGGKYFDTAYPYHNGMSESVLKKAVVERYPREDFLVATKLPIFHVKKEEDMEKYFNEQLEKCGVDYFDYYLIHNINEMTHHAVYDFDSFEFIRQKKREGKIKNMGFSFHDKPEALIEALEAFPECDFIQLQINYLDWTSSTIESRECYEIACQYNKPVIVMEPVKGGALANLPEEAEKIFREYDESLENVSWALRFCNDLDNVFMILNGVSSQEQMESSAKIFKNIKPLSSEEQKLITRVRDIVNDMTPIKCTECNYCIEHCPEHIPIAKYFAIYNTNHINKLHNGDPINSAATYLVLSEKEEYGSANDCIECGACLRYCPQHLDIPELLKDVHKELNNPMIKDLLST
ncbi:MAG: Fe-S oxidoreductase [Methanosphaera sp. rholeuAM270]|nr:MAG: Fe-S oxidoreductase [Methanosphaera sp. rholeuAM270]